ncbi:hypothetical protein Ato02nite_094130 [Paractinoplanes toevensis]|uniref:Uncharacterized protein n=1 Tax=Paractinoplanes toevensis TaxID=571911 RepID=A0A920BR08_9ACTN|nr:hypothetical protein Ato02nite_094130 [Actinoplanes toevensis]
MSIRRTPGPGGFGPSPEFGHGRAGITLDPARTTPRPGVHSGAAVAAGTHLWWWVALVAAVALVAVVVVAVRRVDERHAVRRRSSSARADHASASARGQPPGSAVQK